MVARPDGGHAGPPLLKHILANLMPAIHAGMTFLTSRQTRVCLARSEFAFFCLKLFSNALLCCFSVRECLKIHEYGCARK